MSTITDARAAVPQALHEATLAAAFRGAAVKAGVASLTAAVVRGLVISTAIKGSAVVLALVSIISAGACFATLGGRNRTRNGELKSPPRATPQPGVSGAPTRCPANGRPAWAW